MSCSLSGIHCLKYSLRFYSTFIMLIPLFYLPPKNVLWFYDTARVGESYFICGTLNLFRKKLSCDVSTTTQVSVVVVVGIQNYAASSTEKAPWVLIPKALISMYHTSAMCAQLIFRCPSYITQPTNNAFDFLFLFAFSSDRL